MSRVPDQIIGHKDQLEHLKTDIAGENITHAYLFSGPPHVGKMTIAFWFAEQLLCEGLSEEECAKAKHMIERLTHPDLLVLDQLWMEEVSEDWDIIAKSSNVPQTHRAQAGARTDTISIDDVRALQDRLYATGVAKHRCCIIRSVDRMQDAAANSFLKILEEPPERLVFLLTTESIGSLLPTMVSRARVISLNRLPPSEITAMVAHLPEDDRQFIVALGQGAPGVVHRLIEDPDTLRTQRILQGKASAFWRETSLHGRLQHLAPLLKRGAEADEFLLHLALALRQRPGHSLMATRALTELTRGFETNAHRQILIQRFALSIAKEKGIPSLSAA